MFSYQKIFQNSKTFCHIIYIQLLMFYIFPLTLSKIFWDNIYYYRNYLSAEETVQWLSRAQLFQRNTISFSAHKTGSSQTPTQLQLQGPLAFWGTPTHRHIYPHTIKNNLKTIKSTCDSYPRLSNWLYLKWTKNQKAGYTVRDFFFP